MIAGPEIWASKRKELPLLTSPTKNPTVARWQHANTAMHHLGLMVALESLLIGLLDKAKRIK